MKILRYSGMLAAQFAGMLIIAYVLLNTIWLSRALYGACTWAVLPLTGLFSAYFVTVKGVNNYLAWISPPLAAVIAHYLAFFYTPSNAGPFMVCALCAVIGAAAGDVKKKFDRK